MKPTLALGLALVLSSSALHAQNARPASPLDPAADGPFSSTEVELKVDQPGILPASPLRVRLPDGATTPRPTVLIVHGFAGWGTVHESIAKHLASRGFAAALFQNPNAFDFELDHWRDQAEKAIDALAKANGDATSQVFGKLDMNRFGMLGHSYGGATTIAVSATDPRVKAAVALAPGVAQIQRDEFLKLPPHVATTPILVVGAELDPVVPADQFAWPAYRAMPSPQKLYVEIARAEHLNFADVRLSWFGAADGQLVGTIDPDRQRAIASHYATAWLERFLGVASDKCGTTTGKVARADLAAKALSRIDVPPTLDTSGAATGPAPRNRGLIRSVPH